MTTEEQNSSINMIKLLVPTVSQISTVSTSIVSTTATLTATTSNPNQVGTITMALENGQWRLVLESWAEQG